MRFGAAAILSRTVRLASKHFSTALVSLVPSSALTVGIGGRELEVAEEGWTADGGVKKGDECTLAGEVTREVG